MKKILPLVMVLAILFSAAGCRTQENIKKEIFNLVEKHYNKIVEACVNQDAEALSAIAGIKEVDIVDGYVLVYCQGYGIAPSSQEYGFYYSEENLPVAVFDGHTVCDSTEMVKEGNGYQYIDDGHNSFYTEQIKGNLYFYSNSL